MNSFSLSYLHFVTGKAPFNKVNSSGFGEAFCFEVGELMLWKGQSKNKSMNFLLQKVLEQAWILGEEGFLTLEV